MSENIIELKEEDLANVTGGVGPLGYLQGTSIGFVISAIYEKITTYVGDETKRARLSSLFLEITGYLQICNYEMAKELMKVLKMEYIEIYFDIVIICETQELTQIIPEEDRQVI